MARLPNNQLISPQAGQDPVHRPAVTRFGQHLVQPTETVLQALEGNPVLADSL